MILLDYYSKYCLLNFRVFSENSKESVFPNSNVVGSKVDLS